MPRRDEDDVYFLRDWCKAQGFLFDDSTFFRLSFEDQGVWWSLLLFSMKKSRIPGWFLDAGTGTALREDEIAYELARSVDRIDAVKASIRRLKVAGWLSQTPRDGWSIPGYADRFCTTQERAKIRRADAKRQRDYRAEKRARGTKVVPLSQAEAAR